MTVQIVIIAAIVAQILAAGLALRLIRITGKPLGWVLICSALLLMIIRRALVLLGQYDFGVGIDLLTESVSLLISLFMLAGILFIEPLFRSMQLTQELIRSQSAQLASINRDLESYAYTLTHDLKAPLRRIIGYLDLIREDYPQAMHEAREWLTRIGTNAHEMERLIESILQFSRSGHAEILRQKVNVSAMANEILRELQSMDSGRVVRIRVEPDIQVYTDPNLIRIVLQNLLGNAWKFTRLREDAQIVVSAEKRDGRTFVIIRDNGVGFDESQVTNLFKPFVRLRSEAVYAGFGIGLATVKRIIERLDGDIVASGGNDRGATFSFTVDAGESGAVT